VPEFFADPLLRGLFYGAAFALIETTYNCLTAERPDGTVHFHSNLQGRTTWAMVPGSVLGGLYLLEPFYRVLEPVAPLALRLLLWPLPIWLLEILWGAFLFYGCNGTRAWHYHATARFNGFIKLSYYPLWVGFGAVLELFFHAIGL
jgi:hypothetical protein